MARGAAAARRGGAVELRVLGPVEAEVEGALVPLGGPQQRAILAVMVLRANEVVSVDALCAAIWGEEAPGSAVGVVRTYVSRLRKALRGAGEGVLVSRPPGYLLEIEPERVDAHRFERLVARARDDLAAGRPDRAAPVLRRALGLWRGEALADVVEVGALRPAAVRLEEMRLGAEEARVDAELALGHHVQLIGELETLTRAHPFRERLWGQLIVALYRSNRQADALAAYRALRSALVEQLGIEPSPELRALERDVLAQPGEIRWPPAPDGSGSPTMRAAGPPSEPEGDERGAGARGPIPLQAALARRGHQEPLVGREREKAVLRSHLDVLRGGEPAALFVAGPPGIGKTALVRWFAREAHAAGATVVFGRADDESGAPFQGLDEAIGHWVAHAEPADLEALDRSDALHLARIVPRLADRRPDLPSLLPVGNRAVRRHVFDAVARWLATLACRGPAVVVLDDLHWADTASVLALRHVLRHPPSAGVGVVATYRDTEHRRSRELADLLATTGGDDRVGHLRLDGLADGEVRDLVRRETRGTLGEPGRRFAGRLEEWTAGNPLFIIETLRHLVDRGAIAPDRGRWPEPAPSGFGVPARITELIGQRLRRLPPATAAVLRQASVVGELDVAVLGRMAGRAEIEVVEAIEPALAAQLLAPGDEHPDRFSFAHALVRDAVLAGLPLSERSRLHWRAGQALAALPEAARQDHLGEIALHLTAGVRSGDARSAVEANLRAARHALATLAFEDARDRFATAARLLETARIDDPALEYAAQLGLGQAGGTLADAELQRTGYQRAAALARREGWPRRLALAAVGLAALDLAMGLTEPPGPEGPGVLAPPPAIVREALVRVAERPTSEGCLLLAQEAIRATIADDGPRARRHARTARDLAHRLDDPNATAAALTARSWTLVATPRSDDLRAAIEQALALPVLAEARVLLNAFLLQLLAVPDLQEGRFGELEAIPARITAQPELWLSTAHAPLRVWEVAVALARGQFDRAEQLAGGVLTGDEWPVWREAFRVQEVVASLERGRCAEIRRPLELYVEALPDRLAARAELALVCADLGDTAGAVGHVRAISGEASGGLDRLGLAGRLDRLVWTAPFALRFLAEVAGRLDDAALAAELLPRLELFAGRMLVSMAGTVIGGAADRAIGQLLLALGRVDEAVERLAAAGAFERSAGAAALATRTAHWHGLALLRRNHPGDEAAARTLLTSTATDARRFGMLLLLEQTLQLLDDRG